MDRRWTKRMTLSKRHARRRQNSVKATKKSCDVLEKERGENSLYYCHLPRGPGLTTAHANKQLRRHSHIEKVLSFLRSSAS